MGKLAAKISSFYLSSANFYIAFKPYAWSDWCWTPKILTWGSSRRTAWARQEEGSTPGASPTGAMHPLVVSSHGGCLGRVWVPVGAR